jgi:hypothetical protein
MANAFYGRLQKPFLHLFTMLCYNTFNMDKEDSMQNSDTTNTNENSRAAQDNGADAKARNAKPGNRPYDYGTELDTASRLHNYIIVYLYI